MYFSNAICEPFHQEMVRARKEFGAARLRSLCHGKTDMPFKHLLKSIAFSCSHSQPVNFSTLWVSVRV